MASIFVLNGPNLNLLGTREPHIYGKDTLDDVEAMCRDRASDFGMELDFRQSNHEGTLVDWVHEARRLADGMIVNFGAYSHTSIALLDALSALDLPVIEVHLSNIHAREAFRHKSVISTAVKGSIVGLGPQGYLLALTALADLVDD